MSGDISSFLGALVSPLQLYLELLPLLATRSMHECTMRWVQRVKAASQSESNKLHFCGESLSEKKVAKLKRKRKG